MTPGAYLREMRESRGFSIGDVATLIAAFGLDRNRAAPWFRWNLRPLLAGIEADHEQPTEPQLLSLAVLLGFNVAVYRQHARIFEQEPAHV